jgi:hypothetical protein
VVCPFSVIRESCNDLEGRGGGGTEDPTPLEDKSCELFPRIVSCLVELELLTEISET